jgi:hypothetical protein
MRASESSPAMDFTDQWRHEVVGNHVAPGRYWAEDRKLQHRQHGECSRPNQKMCSQRTGRKLEPLTTHPNCKSHSSLSIAVTVAPSISLCTDVGAWKVRRLRSVGGLNTPERGCREAIGACGQMIKDGLMSGPVRCMSTGCAPPPHQGPGSRTG